MEVKFDDLCLSWPGAGWLRDHALQFTVPGEAASAVEHCVSIYLATSMGSIVLGEGRGVLGHCPQHETWRPLCF